MQCGAHLTGPQRVIRPQQHIADAAVVYFVTSRQTLRCLSRYLEKFDNVYTESEGKALDNDNGRIAPPALDRADVGTVDAVLEGELLLAQACLSPQPQDIRRKSLSHVYGAA